MAREHGSEVVPLPSDATVDDLQDLVVRKNIMRVLVFPKDSRVPRVVPVSYTHLTLPTTRLVCRSRWSPYH